MEPEFFEPFYIYAFNRQAFLFRKQPEKILLPERSFVRCGLPFVRLVAGYLKPTTVFLQRFAETASRNIISLKWQDIITLCTVGEIVLSDDVLEQSGIEAPGYVIINTLGYALGAGLLLDGSRLLCRFPKAMKQALPRISKI